MSRRRNIGTSYPYQMGVGAGVYSAWPKCRNPDAGRGYWYGQPRPRRDDLMCHDVDAMNRELLEGIGHGNSAIVALDQEGAFALAEL